MVHKLVEKCGENADEAKLAGVTLFEHENECVYFYTVLIALAVIALTVSIGIGDYFTYKYIKRNSNKENVSIYHSVYKAKNY